jgi:hypothetical protein
MFEDFWDIIKFHRLKNFEEMEIFFKDIPAVIDKHNEILRNFSKEQSEAYRRILKDMQIIYYGN